MTEETRAASRSGGRSHLSVGSQASGDFYFPGTVELPGYVKGSVEAAAIVIEESGEFDGEIRASSITIKGRFNGQIKGGTVLLHSSARVIGDVTYDSLSVESGALLQGNYTRGRTRETQTGQDSGSAVE